MQMSVRQRTKLSPTKGACKRCSVYVTDAVVRVFFSLWLKQKSGTGKKLFKIFKIKLVPVLCHKEMLQIVCLN